MQSDGLISKNGLGATDREILIHLSKSIDLYLYKALSGEYKYAVIPVHIRLLFLYQFLFCVLIPQMF